VADEYGFDAEISLDIAKAIKAAGELAQSIAKIQDATGGTDKGLDRLERTAAETGRAMEQFAKSGNAATSAAKAQQGSIQRLIKAYNDLNQAQGAQKNKGLVNQQNPLLQQRIKQEQDAAKKQTQYEREFARLSAQEAKKAAAEKARYEQQFSKLVADENKKRAAIEQRTAEQISAVWKKAHAENARLQQQATVAAATRTANQAGAGALRGADPFAGLRESAAYTEMLDRSVQGLANQRYALYDVATTFGLVSVATLGAAAAAVKLGGDYEQAFQQVARTTGLMGPELEEMRHALVGLSTDIPVAFADIAEIATLGAQLNIANDNLDGFTKTVAQFAATTDVSVNAAAMGFGRLAQLTQTPQAEIDRLGSAIYEVGVNSVATESEILAVSQQIATAGNLAGFTNTEVVALASTLASLGVAPEQSRGAIMRVFGDITAAVGEGGDKLQAFARTSNMTSQQFAQAWQDSPQEAFNAYIAGLERVIKTNGDLDTSLKNQGFRNIRDRNVLTRLANNTEVYAAALDDTSRAYEENTALSEGAAIANDNLVDKLTVLMNTVKAVMAEVGQSDALKGFVDALAAAAEAVLGFVQTPVGKTMAVLVLGTGAAIGAFAALAAGAAMGKAALLAIITALYNSRTASAGATLGLKALTVELLRATPAGNAAAAALGRFRAAATAAGGGLGGMTTAARGTAAGMSAAGAATRVFGTALKGIGQVAVPLAILAGVVKTVDLIKESMKDASTVAEEYFEAMDGAGAGLETALAADTKTFQETGDALRTVTTEVETSKTSLSGWATQLSVASGAQVAVNDATSETTTGVQNQTIAIGENVRAWAAQTLANDETFQSLYKNQQLLKDIGFDLNEFLDATLRSPTGGSDYVQDIVGRLTTATGGYAASAKEAGVTTEELAQTVKSLYELAGTYGTAVESAAIKQKIMADVMGDAGLVAQGLGEDLEGASDGALTLADGLGPLVDALFGTVNAAAATQQALNDLGASLGENGNSFSEFSDAGRENLAALNDTISSMAAEAGDDTAMFITNVGGLLQQLEGMGVNVQGELGFVGEMLGDLTNQQYGINLDTSVARGSIAVFVADAIKALQVVAALEKRQAASLKTAGASVPGMGALGAAGALLSAKNKASGSAVDEQIKGLQQLQVGLAGAGRQGNQAGQQIADGFNKGAAAAKKAGGAGKKAGKDAAQGAKEIRTLLDYANDIESVFNRSFEIRFGVDQAADSAADALDKMKQVLENADKAIVDANEGLASTVKNLRDARVAVEEFNAEIQSLRADNKILDYQLNIAVKYGDDLRATDIRAKMAENAVELTKTEYERADAVEKVTTEQNNLTAAEKAVAKAQADAVRSLDGTTASSREQRAAVLALVQSYQGQIQAMASSGASTEELQRKTDQLEAEFRAQMTQMGYNRAETDKYAQSFRDLSVVLANVPRNVTVTANTNPALQALNEFIARTNNSSATVGVNANINGGGTGGFSSAGDEAGRAWGRAFLNATARSYELAAQGMIYPGNLPMLAAAAALRIRAQYLSTGGVAGMGFQPKGTDTQPAMLTPGEYVVKKSTVDRLGIPFMNSLNNMQMPIYRAQGGSTRAAAPSAGGNGVQLMELLPTQFQQLVQAVRSSAVYLDGKQIADATNSYNTQGATRGIR
jgi:TP901 family phage tail tape measure protein